MLKAGATEARDILVEALANRLGDPEQHLDCESVREIETPKNWRQEFHDQLFGPRSPTKLPASNGSRS